jgi:hypothetical protein
LVCHFGGTSAEGFENRVFRIYGPKSEEDIVEKTAE